jgi:NO-binding membrane sensor protein with MHYT domain
MPDFVRRFFDVFALIESEQAYQGTYDAWLVATSILIAILAAFVALSVSARIVGARSQRSRWAWASAGAISMGGGIWAMHFIGMLAFDLPCGVSYDPLGTVLSMIPGTFASGVALYVISLRIKPGLTQLFVGAILMGAGIGAMHYAGMAAMEPEALLRYRPSLFLLSLVVAVALAFISLSIRFHLRANQTSDMLTNLSAAVVMGLAVAGMHYTAMEAAVFYPSDQAELGDWIATNALGLPIAIGAGLIAAFTLITAFAGRQMELAASLREEVARRQMLEHAAESGRARLQAIFDAVADAIVTIDRHAAYFRLCGRGGARPQPDDADARAAPHAAPPICRRFRRHPHRQGHRHRTRTDGAAQRRHGIPDRAYRQRGPRRRRHLLHRYPAGHHRTSARRSGADQRP